MVKVMATGAFDILHMGHIYFLKEAKKLGDKLVVVVACDSTIRKLKHEPVTSEKMRLQLIKELKIVDEAYLGQKDDIYKIVEDIKPDIIALGYDQIHDEKIILQNLKNRNIKSKIVRISKYKNIADLNGTRKIISRIISAYEFQKNIEKIESK